MARSELGDFAELPEEIRVCIWEYLFPYGLQVWYSSPLFYYGPTTPASVLCASRRLYTEISGHLYNNLSLDINISSQYSGHVWVEFTIKKLEARWQVMEEDAIQRGFRDFPFYKVDLIINMQAPNPREPAQLGLLWYKSKKLVEFLNLVPRLKYVTFWLKKGPCNDWCTNRQANQSMPNLDLDDHDVAFLPFTRLKNVQDMVTYAHSEELNTALDWKVIDYGREYIYRRRWIFAGDSEYESVARNFDNLERYLSIVDICIYRRVIRLQSRTADILSSILTRDHLQQENRIKERKALENWVFHWLKSVPDGERKVE
ncbi:hypothetical protein ASPWEDRAFT_30895 [Aspergillus wentii DTO 134E9]|uniref:F-box domain-containing protein n=1 Tax=Aspergillus wentii DTO 134E9 TaxID=1073089 RepID=A0A1L9RAI6_ASPWE|nr:uncharacterized protein ASPWEDRAFT_30895 [Aspergillus wentii DTO 134E9]KAI9934530.1 hypothetical protein MW887_000144 [Aspergillus wentii]OJJ31945.1 hypothetical protein ASPWEDRAFT_30895 [Aspergillus wentii DTO 134E9]